MLIWPLVHPPLRDRRRGRNEDIPWNANLLAEVTLRLKLEDLEKVEVV